MKEYSISCEIFSFIKIQRRFHKFFYPIVPETHSGASTCLGNFWQDFLSCFEYLFFLKSSAYLWLNCILPCIFFFKRLICVKQPPIYITLTWIIKCLLCHFWILWDKYPIVSKNFAFKLEFLHLIWMCQKLAKSKGG